VIQTEITLCLVKHSKNNGGIEGMACPILADTIVTSEHLEF